MKSKQEFEGFTLSRRTLLNTAVAALALGPMAAMAQAAEVALAGLAFSGDAESIKRRFSYSLAYIDSLSKSSRPAHAMLRDAIQLNPVQQIKLIDQIDELKGRDQAIAVALVIGSETISVEQLAGLHKLFVLIRAQAMFFDFKAMAVIRAYPISFAHIDIFDHAPLPAEIAYRVRGVYEGAEGKPGIFSRFATTLSKATLPSTTSRYLQVVNVAIKPEAMSGIPGYISSDPTVADTWAADMVGEALSTRAGVPVIPYQKGYAVNNVMSIRISDGDVYNLALPKPDYEVSVELSALRKIEYGKSGAGTSFIYGSYASVKIEEPVLGKVYLNTALKNGEIKLVPATQTYVDDFPAYYDSIDGLFVKLSEALDGRGNTWVKTAAAATNIDKQIFDTKELIKLCK